MLLEILDQNTDSEAPTHFAATTVFITTEPALVPHPHPSPSLTYPTQVLPRGVAIEELGGAASASPATIPARYFIW